MPLAIPALPLPRPELPRLDLARLHQARAQLAGGLDTVEARLPALPARVLRLQRTVASTALEQAGVASEVLAGAAGALMTGVRETAATTAERARTAGEELVRTACTRAAAVTGRSRTGRDVAPAPATAAPTDTTTSRATEPGSGGAYESWTKAQLVARARALGVRSPSSRTKAELIAALRARG